MHFEPRLSPQQLPGTPAHRPLPGMLDSRLTVRLPTHGRYNSRPLTLPCLSFLFPPFSFSPSQHPWLRAAPSSPPAAPHPAAASIPLRRRTSASLRRPRIRGGSGSGPRCRIRGPRHRSAAGQRGMAAAWGGRRDSVAWQRRGTSSACGGGGSARRRRRALHRRRRHRIRLPGVRQPRASLGCALPRRRGGRRGSADPPPPL